MRFKKGEALRSVALIGALLLGQSRVPAEWNPSAGAWGKSDALDLRVMTFNVEDGISSCASKVEGGNNWCALARIVAAMKPDILILQEAGDNSANCGSGSVDSVPNLTTTVNLFFDGGNDPFHGNSVITSWVQKYAPGYDLNFVFVSAENDSFNRNVIISRYPFVDLNGDTKSQISDIPSVAFSGAAYAPGGDGGIRGFMFAEINLDDAVYAGDVVVGNAHLKAGSTQSDLDQRLEASQNVAYVIDYWFNGAGTGMPDPNARIADSPAATVILPADTAVVIGGDWNEDELTNGRKGPAEWLTLAEFTGGTDGTDRDRTDATYDASLNPFNGSRITHTSNRKYDYLAWQDSIAGLRRSFVFNTQGMSGGAASWLPPELIGFTGVGGPSSASGFASDHRPVIADLILPLVPTEPPDVIISEIMYNPASDESLPNDVEWVEIYNAGSVSVDIGGWYLSDEDGDTGAVPGGTLLPAGSAAVLIPDDQTVAGFQEAWGSGFAVYPLSNWGSPGMTGLSNDPTTSNEILSLRDSEGVAIDTVNFEDSGDWPVDEPDGPSIYVLSAFLDGTANDAGTAWARSTDGIDGAYECDPTVAFDGLDTGSPGFVDTAPAECAVDGDCDDSNPCTDGACLIGTCFHVDDDSNACDDSEYCTVNDRCEAGACVGDPNTSIYADVAPPPDGDGLVELADVLCVLSGYSDEGACPGSDLAPCGGDSIVELADVLAVTNAYSGINLCVCP